MGSNMNLSIVVPVYNMAADNKLQYCLDSLVNQTVTDYEIIAVDDASTDNSLDILREYEARYPQLIRVIESKENAKQGGARNKGIDNAKGKWIGFVDSDDWIAPDMYEKLIGRAKVTGADVVGCDYNLVERQTFEVGKVIQNNTDNQTGILDREKYGRLVMRPGSMVIKIYLKQVIDDNNLRFPQKTFYEDNAAAPNWMLHFKHFERVNEPLYYYYQHDISTVHEISITKCLDRLNMGERMITDAKRYGFLEEYHQEFEFAFSKLYYMNTLFTYMLGVKKPKVKFLHKMVQGMKDNFPNFQNNVYYQQEFDDEQKRMAAMNIKSQLMFMIYFKLLYFYRNNIRGKIRKH
jgi:glycosyltransferase involved in cell wall biosynthesis